MPRRGSRRRKIGRGHPKHRLKAAGLLVEHHPKEVVTLGSRPVVKLSSPDPRTYSGDLSLSIVTATYNRRASLMKMVNSARSSLRSDVPYEIVVVDGSSTDGSQEWCHKESDIVLIQGDLHGAVPNFNAGFLAAKGRYVCMANDDIEFVGDSLQLALDFMPNHPRVGAACIPQLRGEAKEPWVSANR